MYDKNEVLSLLKKMHISYKMKEHLPVYTMEEMETAGILREGRVCKNLFLRNQKGKKHFLVCLPEEGRTDLKELGELLGGERLSFASEGRLLRYLGVTHGAVSPLGVLNDESRSVHVVIDESLTAWDAIGIHPNDNTATLWLSPQDLLEVLRQFGCAFTILKITGSICRSG